MLANILQLLSLSYSCQGDLNQSHPCDFQDKVTQRHNIDGVSGALNT